MYIYNYRKEDMNLNGKWGDMKELEGTGGYHENTLYPIYKILKEIKRRKKLCVKK